MNFMEPLYPPSDPVACPTCKGKGTDPRKRKRKCPTCNGTGVVNKCRECGDIQPCNCVDQNVLY